MGILAVHFLPKGSRKNPIKITDGTYQKGSAELVPDASNIVNRLWIKGGKATSELYTQNISVGTLPIQLYYSPRAPITVTVDGASKTIGIQNIHEAGTHDFLINAAEKLLVPDLCTTGSGTITYKYEYPIKILLEEPASQQKYGVFEDILQVDTDDKDLALELGFKHLYKYSQPIISGSIKPFKGIYKAGEIIRVKIPGINIDADLQIKEVSYNSTPMKPVEITLQLETPERDLSNILKEMAKRIAKLEKTTYSDSEGPVEKYVAKEENYKWLEEGVKTEPVQSQEWIFWQEASEKTEPLRIEESITWKEEAINTALPLLLPSDSLYPSETLYP